ncbi:hypothetical protein TIFTF001_016911 [Ficus carica]|uniref:Uncharacterized protein n=1 Tax=Ficus carica TaxID=3494 RepID=A0AA88APP9_FICCA|nr:hypothetical protein TIFTF001_016911 [Ficus carica]
MSVNSFPQRHRSSRLDGASPYFFTPAHSGAPRPDMIIKIPCFRNTLREMPPTNNINTALSDDHLFDVNCNIWKRLQEQVGQHPLIVNKEITNLGFKRNAVCDLDARLNPVARLIIFQKIKLSSAFCNPNTFIHKHTIMAPGSRPDRRHCRTILELTQKF